MHMNQTCTDQAANNYYKKALQTEQSGSTHAAEHLSQPRSRQQTVSSESMTSICWRQFYLSHCVFNFTAYDHRLEAANAKL